MQCQELEYWRFQISECKSEKLLRSFCGIEDRIVLCSSALLSMKQSRCAGTPGPTGTLPERTKNILGKNLTSYSVSNNDIDIMSKARWFSDLFI